MTEAASNDNLPIPEGSMPGPGWTEQMLEMSAHIGPYPTLLIVDKFGGRYVRVSSDPARSPFAEVVSPEICAIIARVYGGQRFAVPTGRPALARARRAPVLAAVRAGALTGGEAARLLGTSRTYLAHLVNQTDEGAGTPVPPQLRARRAKHDPRQIDLFDAG